MDKKINYTDYIVKGAVIGALYVVLTTITSLAIPYFTFGPIQLRVSEALVILPLFTPAAIPGLFIGCIISNTIGIAMHVNVAGALDILFGSIATLLAAILTRWLRNIKLKGLPILSLLPPVIFNALIVGLELSLYIEDYAFSLAFISVGVSELIVVFALGIPLYFKVKKAKIFD